MLINKIGEFGLIERIKKSIKLDRTVVVGPGDDCAVIKLDKNNYQLLTADMLVEGIDFTKDTDPYLVGRKALAVSISDIAASAGTARYAVVSLGLKKNYALASVDRLIKGMLGLAKEFKINIVGGDISRADKLILNVAMLGVVKKKNLVLRSKAKKGDIILVTGGLGASIKGKHLKFIPRTKEAMFLTEKFKIHAMIDISDGLAQDLGHILKASKVGAVIYEHLIPLNSQAGGLEDALYSGEDFELLFTMARQEAKKLLSLRKTIFHPIGEIMDHKFGFKLIDSRGKEKKAKTKGFRHF